MSLSHILLFTANAFGTGMIMPVLALLYLSHGATIATLPICTSISTAVVVLLELPSGIMSDLMGRKRVYLLSAACMSLSYLLLLFSDRFLFLAVICGITGASRAFSSGTIEALEIENYMKCHGSQGLEAINSKMAVITNIGTTLGSITGGFLGALGDHYHSFLIIEFLLYLFLFIMAACFVREIRPETASSAPPLRTQLNGQLQAIRGCLEHSRPVSAIILTAVALGMTYCTLELYWQPRLQTLLPPHFQWIFGFAVFLGCVGNSFGNKQMALWLQHRNNRLSRQGIWQLYWLFRFLAILSVVILGFVQQVWLFFLVFALFYTFAGAGDLIENTIFHTSIENRQRASMMSLLSLSLRGGGLVMSLLGSMITAGLSADAVWLLIPGLAAVMVAGIMRSFSVE